MNEEIRTSDPPFTMDRYGSLGACLYAERNWLRAELQKKAFHRGEGEFSNIEYCDYCAFSRSWIAEHGHGDTCPIRS